LGLRTDQDSKVLKYTDIYKTTDSSINQLTKKTDDDDKLDDRYCKLLAVQTMVRAKDMPDRYKDLLNGIKEYLKITPGKLFIPKVSSKKNS